jgi:iron-sulfur cluster assembly accessory protein
MTVQDQTAQATTQGATDVVELTDAAATSVRDLLAEEGRDDLMLRIRVSPGGCQGFSYQLYFDENAIDGDHVHRFDGFQVVVDHASVDKLQGATIDFVKDGLNSKFTIQNPNEGGRCACGDSFC